MTKTSVGRGRGRGGQRFVDVVLGSFGGFAGWDGAGAPGGGDASSGTGGELIIITTPGLVGGGAG